VESVRFMNLVLKIAGESSQKSLSKKKITVYAGNHQPGYVAASLVDLVIEYWDI
jgi:hypothetical protein